MNVERLGRVPFASLLGFLLCLCGIAIFCGTGFEALNRIDKLFKDLFYPLSEIYGLQVAVVLTTVFTFIFIIIILIFSCLNTGDTRDKVFKSTEKNHGGKLLHYTTITINYLFIAFWLGILCICMIPLVSWTTYSAICIQENAYWRSIHENKDTERFTYTFNLTYYGLYRSDRKGQIPDDANEIINTATVFSYFCSSIMSIGGLVISCICAIIAVILGLMHMLGALSSNLARLKLLHELMTYRNLVADESETQNDWRFVKQDDPYDNRSRLLSPTMLGGGAGGSMAGPATLSRI